MFISFDLSLLVDAIHGTSDVGSCDCASPCEAEVYPVTMSSTKLRYSFLEKYLQEKSSFDHSAAYIEYVNVTLIYVSIIQFIEYKPAK